MLFNLRFYHCWGQFFDFVRVASDLAVAIRQIVCLFLNLIGEEGVEVVSRHNLLIILCNIQLLGSIPSLNIGFSNQILCCWSIPSLDKSIPLFDFNKITILPGEVLINAVIVLDVIDINLLILKNALEYQLIINSWIPFQIKVDICPIPKIKPRVPPRSNLFWLIKASISYFNRRAVSCFNYRSLAIRHQIHILDLRSFAQKINIVLLPVYKIHVE